MRRPSKAKADSAFQLLTEADKTVTATAARFYGSADEDEVNTLLEKISEAIDGASNKSVVIALTSILADFIDEAPISGDPTLFLKVVRCGLFGEVVMRWREREQVEI